MPREKLLIDQMPLSIGFRHSRSKVDFGMASLAGFTDDLTGGRLGLTPAQIDLQRVLLLNLLRFRHCRILLAHNQGNGLLILQTERECFGVIGTNAENAVEAPILPWVLDINDILFLSDNSGLKLRSFTVPCTS